MNTLSKSDFKVASGCITKLYYRKNKYPSATEGNEFMELLAEGGYMVGKLAQLLYPGEMIDIKNAVADTAAHLSKQNVCLHEATILSNGKIIRIDILNKKGNTLELIEVKSKSWNSEKHKFEDKKTLNEFSEYLDDLAFQYHVLKEAYPNADIKPYFLLPDKSKRTNIEGLNGMFRIKSLEPTPGGFRGFDVDYIGKVEDLRSDNIMTLVDALAPVLNLQDNIEKKAAIFLDSIHPEINKKQEVISIGCKGCEYRVQNTADKLGFFECWGDNGDAEHHILKLTQLGNIDKILKGEIQRRIPEGLRSYKELDPEDFRGKYNDRPYYQVVADKEVILPELFNEIDFKYPIAFIDFEVSKMALPYHKGMRPYENVAFQWSCHTLDANGNLTHSDWINTEESFPNFLFAESLMNKIKNVGTVLIWSKYENTILKDIYDQMDVYNYINPELKSWLGEFVKFDDNDSHGFVDQADIASKYYHHPVARGKYGIKFILPAVLQENKSEKIKEWLEQLHLYTLSDSGIPVNPYNLLPTIEVGEKTTVKDGTGAIRAYQDMMYGLHRDDAGIKAKWKDALRQYCRLDTMAMVVIWEHWRSKRND